MPCTTILVGKKASYDGSTMIARNDDSGAGHYTSKKFVVIHPEEQPRTYKTEISHLTIELPDNPMRYTAVPNAEKGEGVWAASGVNAAQVGMTATETITSNPRVLGADPLVVYQPAEDGKEEVPGGIALIKIFSVLWGILLTRGGSYATINQRHGRRSFFMPEIAEVRAAKAGQKRRDRR